MALFVRITDDVFIDPANVSGFEFKNAIWGRDPDSNIIASAHRARCIVHLHGGDTIAFEIPDGMTPEEVVERLNTLPDYEDTDVFDDDFDDD